MQEQVIKVMIEIKNVKCNHGVGSLLPIHHKCVSVNSTYMLQILKFLLFISGKWQKFAADRN